MARLGDVCSIRSSNHAADKEKNWLLNLDVVEQQTGRVLEYNYVSESGLDGSIISFDTDNVLYSKLRPNLNKVVIPEKDGYATSEMLPLYPDKQQITREYLACYLRSPGFVEWAVSKTAGAKMPRLGTKELLNKEIPLPAVDLQKKFTEALFLIDSLISLRKKQLQKLDDLVKSRFVEMFGDCRTNPKGWNTVALEEIADVGSSKRVFVEELKDQGVPFYRGTEIGALAEGKVIQPELFITEEHYEELIAATGKPKIGDLLMPSICPDGRIWVVDADSPFYFKDGRVLWVHSISDCYDPMFLLYTLKDRIMTDYSSIASGTTFAELKIFALKQCRVFDVPLGMQKRFVTFVKYVDSSRLTIQNGLNRMELLKQSLMQKYFG